VFDWLITNFPLSC